MASCPIDWTELRVAPTSWLSGADLIRVSSLSDGLLSQTRQHETPKYFFVRERKVDFANAYGMMFNALLYQHDRFFLAERISVAIQHRTIGLPLIMFSIFECKKTRRTLRYVLLRFNVTLGKEV